VGGSCFKFMPSLQGEEDQYRPFWKIGDVTKGAERILGEEGRTFFGAGREEKKCGKKSGQSEGES